MYLTLLYQELKFKPKHGNYHGYMQTVKCIATFAENLDKPWQGDTFTLGVETYAHSLLYRLFICGKPKKKVGQRTVYTIDDTMVPFIELFRQVPARKWGIYRDMSVMGDYDEMMKELELQLIASSLSGEPIWRK